MEQSGDQINPAGNRAHLSCQRSCAHTRQVGKARQSQPAYFYTRRQPLWSTEVFKLTAFLTDNFPAGDQMSSLPRGVRTQGWKVPLPRPVGWLTSQKLSDAPAGCSAALSWGWGLLFCFVSLYKNQWVNRVKNVALVFNGQASSLNST